MLGQSNEDEEDKGEKEVVSLRSLRSTTRANSISSLDTVLDMDSSLESSSSSIHRHSSKLTKRCRDKGKAKQRKKGTTTTKRVSFVDSGSCVANQKQQQQQRNGPGSLTGKQGAAKGKEIDLQQRQKVSTSKSLAIGRQGSPSSLGSTSQGGSSLSTSSTNQKRSTLDSGLDF